MWRLEEDLPGLIANCRQLLDANSRFLFLTVYAVRMSAIALGNLLQAHFADLPGKVEFGELAVREEARGYCFPQPFLHAGRNRIKMTDLLTLEVHDLHVNVLTGIYSRETHLPQPLHISVSADLEVAPHYAPIRRCRLRKTIWRSRRPRRSFPKACTSR